MSTELGGEAPDFTLPSTRGPLTLSQLATLGKVVLAFYFEDNTPLCSNEISLLKEDYEIIQHLGAQVVGISADSLDSHQRFEERLGGLPFPLASDEKLQATTAYDVIDESGKRSRRAVFVIDKGGTILHKVSWFHPSDPSQYEAIFQALGFE
jgi:peroxiredoxin Q/BCP